MSRIGILGGSFDPVHVGHLWIALFAREQLLLDEVLIVPAGHPPHKGGGTVASYEERVAILRDAVRGWEGLRVAELESDPTQPSYTVDTLRRVERESGPTAEIWLLLGGDSLRDIRTWYSYEEILQRSRLGVYGRPGAEAAIPAGAHVRWIDGPACGLSSSLVRERLRRGASVRGLVPDGALDRIVASPSYRRGGEGS